MLDKIKDKVVINSRKNKGLCRKAIMVIFQCGLRSEKYFLNNNIITLNYWFNKILLYDFIVGWVERNCVKSKRAIIFPLKSISEKNSKYIFRNIRVNNREAKMLLYVCVRSCKEGAKRWRKALFSLYETYNIFWFTKV